MKDSTAYMLAEMLKGTFKAYGSAYGHGVSGVNMGAKTGTGTYGAEIYSQYNLPDNAAKDVWINGFSPQYTMSVWMGFNKVKEYGTNSFVGHSEQEYPQYLFEDVMSDISSRDGKDFENQAQLKVAIQTHYLLVVTLTTILLIRVCMVTASLHHLTVVTQTDQMVHQIVQMAVHNNKVLAHNNKVAMP